jgi:hypothetical protein
MNGWTKANEGLPLSGFDVLAFYRNKQGKPRIIRAQWIAQFTVDAEPDLDEIGEYNEKNENYYLPEGWWEVIDNWDEYYRVYVTQGIVTHWRPLPDLPE